MGKKVIQINGGITVNADVSVKNFMYMKKIIVAILRKCKIFSKYYGLFSDYMWWNHRRKI